ncbi:MAG: ankyrin repeat domain-containing protein [Bacteroidota bacterium]
MKYHFFSSFFIFCSQGGLLLLFTFSNLNATPLDADIEKDLRLLRAVFEDKTRQAEILIQEGANPDIADYYGISALMYSIQNENDKIMNLLIENGANVDSTDYQGMNALMYALLSDNVTLIYPLIEKTSKINHQDIGGNSAMIYAAYNDDIEVAQALYSKGAKINVQNQKGITPLMIAASFGNFYMTDFLLFYDADTDKKAKDGATALHLAAWYGQEETAGLLLDEGAFLEAEDQSGNTPLIYSVLADDVVMAWYLAESGANLIHVNRNGFSPLILAVASKNKDMVDIITFYDFEEPKPNNKSKSALAQAYASRDVKLISKLESFPGVDKSGLYISEIRLGSFLDFNRNDLTYGFMAGLYESRYGFSIITDFRRRTTERKVQQLQSENLVYQFMEIRNFLTLRLQKETEFFPTSVFSAGLRYGGGLMYSYGDFAGTGIQPPSKLSVSPFLDVFFRSDNWVVSAAYSFHRTGLTAIPAHRFQIGIAYHIPLIRAKDLKFSPLL